MSHPDTTGETPVSAAPNRPEQLAPANYAVARHSRRQTPSPTMNEASESEKSMPPMAQQSHLSSRPVVSRALSPADSARAPSTAESEYSLGSFAPSTADNESLHSRDPLVGRSHSRSSSTSTLRGVPAGSQGHTGDRVPGQRRATVTGLAERRADGDHSRARKTTGRQTFVAMCKVVDLFIPVDIDETKTSMRQSHVGRLAGRGEDGAAAAAETRAAYHDRATRASVG